MSNRLAVSVLDLVGMRAGEPAGSAIARSVDLAQHVELWGYKRFWLAEHHSISGLACSATSVLIGHVAGATKTIRVGSGGVMLPNHAPLVVAEQFGTLEAMYPGTNRSRVGTRSGLGWSDDASATAGFAADRRGFSRAGAGVANLSRSGEAGAGRESDSRAGKQCAHHVAGVERLQRATGRDVSGLPFAFAAHFAPEYLYAAARLYREQFRPSDVLKNPYLIVAVQVIAAETDAAARRLFTTPQQRFLRLIRNQPVELLPPVDSMEPLWRDDLERAAVESRLGAAIVGSDATVKAGLEKLVGEHRRPTK